MLFPAEGASGGGTPAADAGKPAESGGQPAARDWAKEGPDLEKRYADLEGRYKGYEAYGTPEQIKAATEWARYGVDAYNRIKSGEYVPKTATEERKAAQASADPYDGWEERTPAEQARIMREQLAADLRKEMVEPVTKQFEGQQQNILSQLQLAFKMMRHLAKNPDLDVESVMAEAVQEATQPGAKLVDLVIERKLAPQMQARAIEDAVKKAREEERALIAQERDNEAVKQFSGRSLSIVRPKAERGKALGEAFQNFARRADKLGRQAS